MTAPRFEDYAEVEDIELMDPEVDGLTGIQSLDEQQAEEIDEEELRRRGIEAMYGADCPIVDFDPESEPDDQDWATWVRAMWDRHSTSVTEVLASAERNRLGRKGVHWLSRETANGPWREPPQPRDAVRPVANMIRPALDQRLQILTEQRPGFRMEKGPEDPQAQKRAEAQQAAVEYQFSEQNMRLVMKEAAYWAQTDGVSFFLTWWDPDAGPWSEYDPNGVSMPMGDNRTCVLRVEEVRVSANATATEAPFYWIVKKPMALAEAVSKYGSRVLEGNNDGSLGVEGQASVTGTRRDRMGMLTRGADDLLRDQQTIDRYWLFCKPSEFLPQGLLALVVGEAVVYVDALPCGCIPIVRVTDGSSDPAFYPEPIMNDWWDDQMRVNTTLRLWIEGIRRNIGGRLLYRPNAISPESLVGGLAAVIEVKGGASLADAVRELPAVGVGQDVKELLQFAVTSFENKSGWNDTSRGSFNSDPSGRSVLAQREILERIFAPPVDAMASALSEWAKIQCEYMKCYYDQPRQIAVTGEGRPDLGRMISAEDFDGISEVHVDPETLMPLPRSMRLFLLDQMYDKQQMSAAEWRRRSPFASVRNLSTPDDDQEAAARRVAEFLRQGVPAQQIWMQSMEKWVWDEAIFQDVLQRELLLPADTEPPIKQEAITLWTFLAQQSAMKQGAMNPGMMQGGPSGSPSPSEGSPNPLGPAHQPLALSNPGVSAAPLLLQSGTEQAASQFEGAQPV